MASDSTSLTGEEPFGLYIHWPFCLSKCPYCDFNSHPRSGIDQQGWANALADELDRFADRTGPRTVTSIFFGGGTPSLMEAKTVGALLDRAAKRWILSPDIEISLEANPTSAEQDRFRDYRAAGVNRLSLGVQALDDEALKKLGRRHDSGEAIRAIELARALFPRLSFDLIYARAGQDFDAWREELAFALALAADHLSLYQLTIAPGTGFFAPHQRGDLVLPDAALSAELYLLTDDMCSQAGLPAYEVSNYAMPGAQCRGNLLYWQGGDYVGVGPGAHGRLSLAEEGGAIQSWAFAGMSDPDAWLRCSIGRHPEIVETELLSPEERAWEMIMMGLRLVDGIDIERNRPQCGGPLSLAINENEMRKLIKDELLERRGGWLCATLKGRLVLDAITTRILI